MPRTNIHLGVYEAFRAIPRTDSLEVMRFCKEHAEGIAMLEPEAYFDVRFAYLEALFAHADWGYLVFVADEIIQFSMEYNIVSVVDVVSHERKDVFRTALMYKAQAYYYLDMLLEAQHIFNELRKIAPSEPSYREWLYRCLAHERPRATTILYRIATVAVYATLAVNVFSILVIDPFFENYLETAEYVGIGMAAASMLFLVAGWGVYKYHTFVKYRRVGLR